MTGTLPAPQPDKSTRAAKAPEKVQPLTVDFLSGKPVPSWVRETIETSLAIESEDARRAGATSFMSRALVLASLPYRDPKTEIYSRRNGSFELRILAGYSGGIPFGTYPRLLMNWVTTEAVRTQSPELHLGDSLAEFMSEMGIPKGGGQRGSHTRFTEQMKRLFGSLITAQYESDHANRSFQLRNVLIAERLDLAPQDMRRFDAAADAQVAPAAGDQPGDALWRPQLEHEAGTWSSRLRLTDLFYREVITSPVPVDRRAVKALSSSPLAMDVYSWLTYRMFAMRHTQPIRWEQLMMQFGTSMRPGDDQARRDFKKQFLAALRRVLMVYPQARVESTESSLILKPSPTHVSPAQRKLF